MKNVMKKMIVLVALVIIASGMMTGCGKTKGEARKEKIITGEWKEVDGSQTIEFFKNGTVIVADKDEPSLPGDYRFIDDNQIRMNLALFGPITAEISSSLDEITLTNPFGKVEKYREIKQMGKVTKSNIAGKYIQIIKTPAGEEFNFGILTWKEDGTGLVTLSGEWEITDNQLELQINQNDTVMLGGEITADTLCRQSPTISLTRKRDAKMIKKLGKESILWSSYYFTGDRSSKVKSVSLEIKEHGAFREITLIRDAWRIKDGVVEITTVGKNQKEKNLKGKLDGDTIVFRDGETEIRFVMAGNTSQHHMQKKKEIRDTSDDNKPPTFYDIAEKQRRKLSIPVALPSESKSNSQRKEAGGLESIDPSETLWVKCKNPDCEVEYQTSKRSYFEYVQKHMDPMAMVAPPAVCKKCGKESIYRAEKCGNPDCRLVFFRGTVPNDFADRCPECGYSETEEQRKSRRSAILSSETTDPSSARRSRRVRRR